ncbi:MAG TPA: CopD family protein [Xanthobacteraceae bacterium]|nr:CopD family protein [Xanthobacteraceae bacterium]
MRGCRLALLLAVLACLAPAPAWAHASLIGSEPPAGVTLADPPATLRLDFNEPVSPLVVRLVGPTGEAVTPAVTAQNSTLTIVPPRLGRGTYTLSWRVISADGHPVGGAVLFSIGAPSAGPALAGLDTDPAVKVAIWATRLLIYLGLFVGIGGASFIALIAQARPLPGRMQAWIAAAMAGGFVASIVSLSLQGLDGLALRLTQFWRPDVWTSGLATSYGRTAVVAALAMLLGLVSLRATRPALVGLCASCGLAGTGFALALSGHAATAGLESLSRPAVFLHGVCIAFWVGSLLPLAAIVRAGGRRDGGDAELARFSRLIPVPLAVLIASGSYLAWQQLDRPDALWTTSYGMVLAAKLVAVLGLLGLAAANRYVLVPRLKARAPGAVRPLAAAIATESVLALAILGTVALWRFTPPPRALIAAEPTSIHFHGGKAMVQIEVEPVRARGAEMSIDVLDPAFHPLAAKAVTIFLSNAKSGIEPLHRDADRLTDSGWRIDDLRIPIAGRWTLRVDVLISDFEKETLEDDVLLPRAPSGGS